MVSFDVQLTCSDMMAEEWVPASPSLHQEESVPTLSLSFLLPLVHPSPSAAELFFLLQVAGSGTHVPFFVRLDAKKHIK